MPIVDLVSGLMLSHTEVAARLFYKKSCFRICFVKKYQCRLKSDSAENGDVKNNEERLKKLLENIKLKRVPLGAVVQDANTQKEQKQTGNENFVNHARAHARREALDAAKAFNQGGSKLKSIQNDLTSLCEIALGSKEMGSQMHDEPAVNETSSELNPTENAMPSKVNEMQSFLQETYGDKSQFDNIPDESFSVENDESEAISTRFDGFSLVDLLSEEKGLKPEKTVDRSASMRSSRRHKIDKETDRHSTENLYGTVRLNIFDKPTKRQTASLPVNSYDVLLQNDMEELFQPSVRNGFDYLIKLTKERKLWTFPIDNELGFEEEENVPFQNHIFLERYCKNFPKHPRIQKFMKVVCLGLSKNHKLTFAKKISHIQTLQQFFEERFDLLKNSADFEDEQNRI